MKIGAAALALLFATRILNGQIVNGDFETPQIAPGGFVQYNVGDTLPGWTITKGSVDIVGSSRSVPPNFGQSLDLVGTTLGRVEQALSLIPDVLYKVKFS